MRKFSEYVLIPNHKSGKDKIFLGILGYRPKSIEDAQEILTLYIEQAQAKFANREYIVRENNQYVVQWCSMGIVSVKNVT